MRKYLNKKRFEWNLSCQPIKRETLMMFTCYSSETFNKLTRPLVNKCSVSCGEPEKSEVSAAVVFVCKV